MFDAQTVGLYMSTCEYVRMCACLGVHFVSVALHFNSSTVSSMHLGSRQIAKEDVAATWRETAILHEPSQDCFELSSKWTILRAELKAGSKRVSPNGPLAQKWTLEMNPFESVHCSWSWNAALDDPIKGCYFKVSETVANTSTHMSRVLSSR